MTDLQYDHTEASAFIDEHKFSKVYQVISLTRAIIINKCFDKCHCILSHVMIAHTWGKVVDTTVCYTYVCTNGYIYIYIYIYIYMFMSFQVTRAFS